MNKKWYQTSGGIVTLLILFFPVGLYLMWKHTNWNRGIKSIVSGFFALLVVAAMFGGNAELETNENEPNVSATAETDIKIEKEAEAIQLEDETTDADITAEEKLFKDMAVKLKDYEIRINGSVLYIEKRFDGSSHKAYIYTSRDAIKVAYEFADRFPEEIESICAWYNASFMDKLGNTEIDTVYRINMPTEVLSKINWDNYRMLDFEDLSGGDVFIHPALSK